MAGGEFRWTRSSRLSKNSVRNLKGENAVSKKQTETAEFSPRSQRSILREAHIRRHLDGLKRLIQARQEDIAQLTSSKERAMQIALEAGNQDNHARVRFYTSELERVQPALSALKDQAAFAQSEIDKLAVTPAQTKARAQHQAEIAALASDRLQKDVEIDSAIDAVRALLRERAAITEAMQEHAADVDLQADLDAERAEAIYVILPENFSDRSREWTAWLLGQQQDISTYITHEEQLVLRETLASAGVYGFGDAVELTEKEAAGVLGLGDHPELTQQIAARVSDPLSRIVSPEVHESAVAEAKNHGLCAEDRCLAYRVRVKTNVSEGGRQYVAGEFMDTRHLDQAGREQLIASGAVERL